LGKGWTVAGLPIAFHGIWIEFPSVMLTLTRHSMITEGTTATTLAQLTGATALAVGGAAVSWLDHLEQVLRMGASCVAILSGLVVIVVAIRNHKNKQRRKNKHHED
jgi:hypothetical protein